MLSLYKKAAILLLLFIFCSSVTFAQKPLTLSKERSYYTYIYKLATADVLNFYKYPGKKLDEHILQHPIDSFKTSSHWKNTLPAGNYLKVYAEKNRLSYSLIENHSVFIKVLHNDYDQRFVLQDKQGNNIVNAAVRFNGKAIKFDDKSSTWHVKSSKKANMVQADYAGVSNFYIMKQQGYDRDDDGQNWFAALWASIKKIFKKDDNYKYSHYRYKQKPKPYIGFVVFNKPLYKPNDTVKFKAFILNAKTKLPVTQKKLLVKLHNGRQSEGKTIGIVSSYRDGGFEYSFALSDTLTLDENYSIALVDPDAKKTVAGKEGNYNLYNDPSVLIFSGFRYEEYELKSTKFDMRTDKKEHWRGTPLAVYLKATDENDLPVPDGRVILTLTASSVNSYAGKRVFVPDTLWVHHVTLDPLGETKVIIPDSIFPAAHIYYNVDAQFLNSNNEERSKSEYVNFNNDKFNIITELVGDTLKANYQQFGKDIKGLATISALSADDDTISKVKVSLPAKALINPNAVTYNIETDSTDTDVVLKDFEADLSVAGERSADSLLIKVNNPRKLHFWYSVFADDKLIDQGEANNLFYKKPYHEQKKITFWVNYIWGGVSKNVQAAVVYRKDLLTINVKQPVSVYPGQQVKTDIVVTDATGNLLPMQI